MFGCLQKVCMRSIISLNGDDEESTELNAAQRDAPLAESAFGIKAREVHFGADELKAICR